MTQKLMFLFLLFVVGLGYSQKVAVIGINHTGTDGFSFVATQDLAAGEVIYFTENEYNDATNTFVDISEAVVQFTAGSAILKGNVVFVSELGTANTYSVTCTGGGSCGTAVTIGAGPFALGTGGESLYAYTDSDSNPLNGITTIYSVLYTGYFEGTNVITGGDIVASQNPVFDFPNAIVIDGFPAVPPPDRVEFTPTSIARTNVSKVVLENPSNYVHAQTSAALSTIFFTNLNLVAADPVVSVTASPLTVHENSGTGMVYTFSLSATATSNLTINFSVGGSATFGSDYSQSGAASFNASAGSVTISNGSNSASITLTPTGDSVLEANESIVLTLTGGSGYVAGSPGAATTTINNDDTLTITPIVAVTGVNHSTTADGFSFVALQDIAAGTVVYFTENPFSTSTLTFSGSEAVMQWTAPAGGLLRGQVVVATETAANTFTTTCSSGSCGSVSVVSGTFTLATTGEELYAYLDSDNNPTNGVTSVQTVLFTGTTTVSGGTIPSAQDPVLVYPGAVVVDGFPAVAPLRTEYNPALRGTTVDRANFQNPANWINGGSNITLSTVPFANIIISTGVANPFASVTVAPSSVAENSGTAMVYTFALSSVAASNITLNFNVGGTATFTTDYTASGASSFTASAGSVVIPTGASSATVSITSVGDLGLEVQESVVLTITGGTGYDGGSPNAATGFINNDDTTDSDPLVALVGMSHVTPDGFSFVAAQDIPANTVVYFTDNSFNNTTLLFGSGEGVIRWTSPGTIMNKGNVVVVTETAPDTYSVTCSNGTCGSVTLISGNLAIATTGETFYAYEDNDTNPSNGVTDIYAVLFTGTPTTSGGNLPSIEDPSNIFLKALVVDGFPAIAPARTEYDPTKRAVAVSAANFEDVSNWIHAQSPLALSTVPFANLNILDNVPPTAVCQNISVTPNVGTGSVTITASQIDNGSSDNAGAVTLSVSPDTFTCANVGTPVTVTLTVTDTSGNTATCTSTVTVLPNVTSTFTQIDPICSGDTLTLPTTSNNGFTGTWSPAINNTATTTYTFTPNAGQCGGPTTMTVVVNPSVTPTFDPVGPICAGAALVALPTTSLNGITGAWSPALDNTATTTYTFTPDAGQCASTTTLTITVNSTPSPVTPNLNVSYTGQCGFLSGLYIYEGLLNGKASFHLSSDTTLRISFDGVKWVLWCCSAITSTGFENTNVPAGLYPPTTGWIPTQCSNGEMTIISDSSFALCVGSTLADAPVVGTNIQWYDAATNGNLLPASTVVTTGTYYVTQTINGCESVRGAVTITVNPLTTPTFNAVAPICSGGTLTALPTTSLNGITGTWSPAPNTSTTTTYTFTPDAGQCASTTTLTVDVVTPPGNPSVFGNNEWNVYAWNSGGNFSSDNPWVNNYSGFYTATGVNFNTQNQWNDTPSDAPGYQGCTVGIDNHSWSAKRQGFPTNYYSLNVDGHDDTAELYINGSLVWDHQGCCDSHAGVWQGILGPTDQVEFRATEGVGGTYGILSFDVIVPTISASGATTFCDGGSVILTSSPTIGTGYLWSNGATTQSITVTTAGNYSVQYTGIVTSDPSATTNVVVNSNPVVTVAGNSSICVGDSVTLTANGADNIAWNISTTTIPLDAVSGAKLAIGLRKLKSTYTGSCIRLRRDSDNAQSDFGFNGNDLDTASISTWLNGATGYCVTLYDQSENGGNVTQSNDGNQPTLVINGYAGKPVLHFNTAQYMYNTVDYTTAFTAIYGARQTGGSRQRVLSSLNNNWLLGYWNGAKQQAYYEGWVSSNPGNPAADDNFYVYSGASDGLVSQLYENGTLIENNGGGVTGPLGIELNGWLSGNEMSDFDFTEVFLFDSVLSSISRNAVENSTNAYYGVVSTPSITVTPAVTTTYSVTGTNNTGCSVTTSFTVTVNPFTTNTTTITAPNSYTWAVNGTTYTTSGTYTFLNGCVTEILNLTIVPGNPGPTIIPSQCGVTLDIYNRIVYATAVPGAQRYRFRVTNLSTNQVVVVENPLRHLFLRNLPIYEYDQAYDVEVAVRVNNVWSNFGAACTITTPVVTTQVRASQCGATLATKLDIVYADNVSGVIGYRFRVTNQTSNSVQIIDRSTRAFQFNAVTDYSDATNYSIEVALLNTDNTYLPYGAACIVTTPVTTGKLAVIPFDVVGYPNPFDTAFKLDVKSSSTNIISVKVYDMIGKLIEERQVNANEIDVFEVGSNYAQGVYNVIVSQDDAIQTIRMVKR